MSSDANEKLQDEATKIIQEIERNYLRKMQGQMFRCSAECCDDATSSSDRIQRCVQNCGHDVQEAQKFVQNEIDNFQDRLNRCHMACYDKIRDKLGVTHIQSEAEKYRKELDNCALDCAESHILLLSQIYKRTKEFFNKSDFQVV